jgi:tRNA (guanosine-2'-O-)-methyltransferase
VNSPLGSTELKRLHRAWRQRTVGRLALVLDGVQQPFNVGAIVRTAAAFRVDHLWVAGETRPDHPKVGRTALGTDRYLTWSVSATGVAAVAEARAAGYTVVAVELAHEAAPLHELPLSGDICLVVGHEDRGVHRDVLAAVDLVGFVPQLGRVGSLNVATAAAIACYEARRQAWGPGSGGPTSTPAPSPG